VAALSARRSRDALAELVRLVLPCLSLLRDVLRDKTVPCRAKIIPGLALAYLAMPIDLIPDFIPVIGHLDDAIVLAWAIRHVIVAAGPERLEQHWKGDPDGLRRVMRLAGVR
jgi:uncharacterized membrane protein YkvA (DUF1232 family)